MLSTESITDEHLSPPPVAVEHGDGNNGRELTLVIGTLAGLSALISVVFWPGLTDADTVGEIGEAARGHFTNWHAPILTALWRLPYLLGLRSPGWVLFVGVFTLLLGFYLVLRVRFSRVWSTVIAGLCCIFPPVLSWGAHVGVDEWFTGLLLCAFGFAARSARTIGRVRNVSTVAAVVAAFLCDAARHNALPAVLVLFIVIAAMRQPKGIRFPKLNACILGCIALLGTVGVQSGIQWAIGAKSKHPVQTAMEFDIAQLSKEAKHVLLPSSLERVNPAESLVRVNRSIEPGNADPLFYPGKDQIIPKFPLEGQRYAALQSAWISAVLHHPREYLNERLVVAGRLFSISQSSYFIYDPPGAVPQFSPKFPTLDRAGISYLALLSIYGNYAYGGFLFDVWIYALILMSGAVLMVRRSEKERVIAALAIGTLLYGVILIFSVPLVTYRYAYPLVAVGTVMLPLLIPHRRHQGDASPLEAGPDHLPHH